MQGATGKGSGWTWGEAAGAAAWAAAAAVAAGPQRQQSRAAAAATDAPQELQRRQAHSSSSSERRRRRRDGRWWAGSSRAVAPQLLFHSRRNGELRGAPLPPTRVKVVEHPHSVPQLEQQLHEVAADEACSTQCATCTLSTSVGHGPAAHRTLSMLGLGMESHLVGNLRPPRCRRPAPGPPPPPQGPPEYLRLR